jgi:hypothetical protein
MRLGVNPAGLKTGRYTSKGKTYEGWEWARRWSRSRGEIWSGASSRSQWDFPSKSMVSQEGAKEWVEEICTVVHRNAQANEGRPLAKFCGGG